MPFAASVYLVTALDFDLRGTPVRLWGTIEVKTGGDPWFVLDSDTSRIQDPLGMTGVVLDRLSGRAHLRKRADGGVAADLTVAATASFPSLPGTALTGALVFQGTAPRLAIVALEADSDHAISLTKLVGIIGGPPESFDEVTDEFAFYGGSLYYLHDPSGAEFTYRDPLRPGPGLVCKPGYHLDCKVRVFGEYDFQIGLAVEGSTFVLAVTSPTVVNVGIMDMKVGLEISTRSQGKYLRFVIDDAHIFGQALPRLEVAYRNTNGANVFSGAATIDSVGVALALRYEQGRKAFIGTVSVPSAELTIGFTWRRGSLRIDALDGLSDVPLDLAREFTEILNGVRSNGCESVVQGWFKDIAKTTLRPRLDPAGVPSKRGDGKYRIPLTLRYEFRAVGATLTSDIPFDAILSAPNALSDIPGAVASSILQSAGPIAQQILSDPNTYQFLLLEVGKTAGAKALARFICRALQRGFVDLAKALARAAAGVVADTLADAVALAAMLTSVALLGVPALISTILGVLEAVWDWLTGDNDDEKEEAEANIRAKQAEIKTTMDDIWRRIDAARNAVSIRSLAVTMDEDGMYVADWTPSQFSSQDLGTGVTLGYVFELLTGEPGDVTGHPLAGNPPFRFDSGATAAAATELREPLSGFANADQFRLNASVAAVIKGADFSKAEEEFDKAIAQLRGVSGSDAVNSLRQWLEDEQTRLRACRLNGIVGTPTYAQLAATPWLVGHSHIGAASLTTKLPR